MNMSTELTTFYIKIEEAAAMLCNMVSEDKLRAVCLWNMISERLQTMLNKYVEEQNPVALQVDNEMCLPYCDASHITPPNMNADFIPHFMSPCEEPIQQTESVIVDHCNAHAVVTYVSEAVNENIHTTEIPYIIDTDTVDVILEPPIGNTLTSVIHHEQSEPLLNRSEEDEVIDSILEQEEQAESQRIIQPLQCTEHDSNNNQSMSAVIVSSSTSLHPLTYEDTNATSEDTNVTSEDTNVTSEDANVTCDEQPEYVTSVQLPKRSYPCQYCDKAFASPAQLSFHTFEHTGEETFQCKLCGIYVKSARILRQHIKNHKGEKPWECDICKATFTERKSLRVHMRRHTGERPYSCTVCSKTFSQSNVLRAHMAVHLDEKKYNCRICHRSFRQKSNLQLHEQRHAGIRKFTCPVCHYMFLVKGDLERHMRTHTGERPFTCEICHLSYPRSQSLKEHMNRHYLRKPYECKYCCKGFADLSNYGKHVRTHEKQGVGNLKKQQAPSAVQTETETYPAEVPDHFLVNSGNIGVTCWLEER